MTLFRSTSPPSPWAPGAAWWWSRPAPPTAARGRSLRCRAVVPDRKSTRLNPSHTEIYTLSLHDALPIYVTSLPLGAWGGVVVEPAGSTYRSPGTLTPLPGGGTRSEEHTSEPQSHRDLHSFPT